MYRRLRRACVAESPEAEIELLQRLERADGESRTLPSCEVSYEAEGGQEQNRSQIRARDPQSYSKLVVPGSIEVDL